MSETDDFHELPSGLRRPLSTTEKARYLIDSTTSGSGSRHPGASSEPAVREGLQSLCATYAPDARARAAYPSVCPPEPSPKGRTGSRKKAPST